MGQERNIRTQITTDGEGVGSWYNTLEVWNDNFDDIRKIVDGMQPDQVQTGAQAYDDLAKRMNSSAQLIYKQGTRMAEAWGGDDAKKAMEAMNKTYRQVQEIEKVSDTTSKAMATHAKQQRAWKTSYGSGSQMDSWVKDVVNWGQRALALNPASAPAAISGLIGNNIGANNVMNDINDGTVKSNGNFPAGIRQDLASPNLLDTDFPEQPPGGKPPGSPKMPGGPGAGPGGPGDLPTGPGDMPTGPGGPGGPGDIPGGPNGPGGGPNGPGGPGGPGDLPGGPGGIGGGPGGIGSGPGGPGTDLASMPGSGPGLGGGGGGLPGGMPGGAPGGGAGLGGGVGAGPGGLGAGVGPGGGMVGGPGAFGKNSMGGRGGMGMGMPMGAGARPGGDGGDEHERKTWLTEDEDVWGGDDDTAPPVIG